MRKHTHLTMVSLCLFAITACTKTNTNLLTPEVKADWTSDAQWANKTYGSYTVYNNIWGQGPGYQSIWANSGNQFGVWSNHPNTGGVKSYPHSSRNIKKALSTLGSCKSTFNITVPSSGSWGADYDIWTADNEHEIMLWMNYRGAVVPISYKYNSNGAVPEATNVSIGGHTWKVYRGSNGSNIVFSFLRTGNTNSGTVDVKAIMNYIKGKGWFSNPVIDRVEFGFEITSSSGGMNHTVNNYTVTYN